MPRSVGSYIRLLLPVSFLAVVLLAACGSSPEIDPNATPVRPSDGSLTLRAFEWGYEPQVIELALGEEVRITVENDGDVLHNFKIGELEATGIDSRSGGGLQANEGDLLVWAGSDEQGTLAFTPVASGTFAFYCTVRGHRQLGMEGVVIVTP